MPEPTRSLNNQKLLRHADYVKHLARALLTNGPEEAADLEQDVWMNALRAQPHRSGDGRGFLATIARNLRARTLRDRMRRAARETQAARAEATLDEDLLARQQLLEAVTLAVGALDPAGRTVVLLRFYEGMTPQQIGKRLEIPAATVRTRLHRALKRLEGSLSERVGPDWRPCLAAFALGLPHGFLVPSATGAATLGGSAAAVATTKSLATTVLLGTATMKKFRQGMQTAAGDMARGKEQRRAHGVALPPRPCDIPMKWTMNGFRER